MNLQRLREQLKIDEGVRAEPYADTVGKLTVGVGRNIDDKPFRDDEIDLMLTNDISEAVDDCRRLFSGCWNGLTEERKEVLVNMMFNLGYPRLRGFKKMHAALLIGDYEEAAIQMIDSKWAKQVGKRASRLAQEMRGIK